MKYDKPIELKLISRGSFLTRLRHMFAPKMYAQLGTEDFEVLASFFVLHDKLILDSVWQIIPDEDPVTVVVAAPGGSA